MSKYNLIVADPPWEFGDKLKMSAVKRGAESNYPVLNIAELCKLRVPEITEDNAVLALWVPGSMLADGMACMSSWGFKQKQILVWVKTQTNPFKALIKSIDSYIDCLANNITDDIIKDAVGSELPKQSGTILDNIFDNFSWDNLLSFGMGRIFRQCHEIALIGTKGKVSSFVANKSQRSVLFAPVGKHSAKPDSLQAKLETIFPALDKRLEMFARRDLPGWNCIGDECPTVPLDIRTWIENEIASNMLVEALGEVSTNNF